MSLAPLLKPACCIASSSHFHVVGISVSETVLHTNLRLDGTPEHRRTQIAVCPKTREHEHLVGNQALCWRFIINDNNNNNNNSSSNNNNNKLQGSVIRLPKLYYMGTCHALGDLGFYDECALQVTGSL